MEMRKRPEPIRDFQVHDLGEGIWNITAPPMRFQQYLVLGDEKALLIDTGFGLGSLKKVVDGITDLPIVLLNTHGHPDHGGGNAEFGSPLLHPADNELYAEKCSYAYRYDELTRLWHMDGEADKLQKELPAPLPLEDGARIDLGGRVLTVLHTPGHTMGSVCVFDEKTGSLFAGDNLNAMATGMTEDCASTISEFLASLQKLAALPVTAAYTGHMPARVEPSVIAGKIECCEKILAGEPGEVENSPRGNGLMMRAGGTGIHYRPDRAK